MDRFEASALIPEESDRASLERRSGRSLLEGCRRDLPDVRKQHRRVGRGVAVTDTGAGSVGIVRPTLGRCEGGGSGVVGSRMLRGSDIDRVRAVLRRPGQLVVRAGAGTQRQSSAGRQEQQGTESGQTPGR